MVSRGTFCMILLKCNIFCSFLFLFVFSCVVYALIYLHLTAGVDDNETIKIYRGGGADPESNQPGDLYVTIKVGTCNHAAI